jgi:hypothetical protein
MELAQLVEGFLAEPSEAELRGISKELANSKAEVQATVCPLMRSDSPSIASNAYKLVQEAKEIASKGQKNLQAVKEAGREPGGLGDQQD